VTYLQRDIITTWRDIFTTWYKCNWFCILYFIYWQWHNCNTLSESL